METPSRFSCCLDATCTVLGGKFVQLDHHSSFNNDCFCKSFLATLPAPMTDILQVQKVIISKAHHRLRSCQFKDCSALPEATRFGKRQDEQIKKRISSLEEVSGPLSPSVQHPSRPTMSTPHFLLGDSMVKSLYMDIVGVEMTPLASRVSELFAHIKVSMDFECIKRLGMRWPTKHSI
jgi:hypothetical protein